MVVEGTMLRREPLPNREGKRGFDDDDAGSEILKVGLLVSRGTEDAWAGEAVVKARRAVRVAI